ncbi:multidrug effflux MFS transporter [Francisella hispaniensis]|uniref:Bcr/CflA family efflux transporter n=1 Tax=Francisella hispaniensis FSC454 TaxID=1088883 RepID=A0AAC9J9P4_9GAMM|nr:multidrug effflux MFS transporter [Francisella hispaniensis]APD50333.1 Bcr/CflA family drug resistance efflux transporter [Francisella hispaniensis FSC454]KYW88471.1 Bcr/CflA family drug resistance efflux transporter [Francisella hispaniensis FSC454]
MIKKDSKLFILTLGLLAMLPPFAVNTYAPAIPNIAEHFGIHANDVIFTFTTYFIGFSIGMLFWGSFSDKFGRKLSLILGMFLYAASTLLCAHSQNFSQLAIFRLIQGLTDSSGTVIALAIARDCYSGKKLTNIISTLAIIMLISPIISPMIGTGLIVSTQSWKSSFYFLFGFGIVLLILCSKLPETHAKEQREKSIKKLFIAYFYHLRNLPFTIYTICSGLLFAAFFSYIGASSIIYLNVYDTGYTLYMLYFALTIIGVILANLTLKKFSESVELKVFTRLGLGISLFSVFVMVIYSHTQFKHGYIFMLLMLVTCYGLSLSSTSLLSQSLQLISNHFGAATAVNNFFKFSLAGFANFVMSFSVGSMLVSNLPLQQLTIILITIVLLYTIKFYEKTKYQP